MKATTMTAAVLAVLFLGTTHLIASGPLGIYGIVERVVFEPSETAPERVQVWGAFAYVDGDASSYRGVSAARRGYLYFKLPPAGNAGLAKTEWADLKAVAGTGQAIAFGHWRYVGGFGGLQPATRGEGNAYILEAVTANRSQPTDLRVRAASEAPTAPAAYQTNAGIVKLAENGSHASIVKELKSALGSSSGSGFRLDIGAPIAGNAPNLKKDTVLVVRPLACSDPASAQITGTAEGIVNGARRSVPLKLMPLDKPGVHAVTQQWPDGQWVLSLSGTCRGATAGALVPVVKKTFLRESSKFLPHAPTASEIDASLNALAGSNR